MRESLTDAAVGASNHWRGHVFAVMANVLYAVNNVVTKMTLGNFSPILFQLIREAIAGPILIAIAYWWEPVRVQRSHLWLFLAAGSCMWGINLSFAVGVKMTGAVTAAAWQPANPVLLTLLATLCGTESFSVLRFVGIVISALGCLVFVVLGTQLGSPGSQTHTIVGNMLLFAEGLFLALFLMLSKTLVKHYPPLVTLGYSYIVCTVEMLITALIFNTNKPLLDSVCPDCSSYGWDVPETAWPGILFAAFVVSILAYFLSTTALQYLDASIVGAYTVTQPVGTFICAAIVVATSAPPHWGLRAAPHWKDFGILGIVIGLLIVSYDAWLRENSSSSIPESDSLLEKTPTSYQGVDDKLSSNICDPCVKKQPKQHARKSCSD